VSLALILHVISKVGQGFLHEFHVLPEDFKEHWIQHRERVQLQQSGTTLVLVAGKALIGPAVGAKYSYRIEMSKILERLSYRIQTPMLDDSIRSE